MEDARGACRTGGGDVDPWRYCCWCSGIKTNFWDVFDVLLGRDWDNLGILLIFFLNGLSDIVARPRWRPFARVTSLLSGRLLPLRPTRGRGKRL